MRSIAIIILLSLGTATYQLPILWATYQTVHANYALQHCVNKGTSCHGSCTMKRAFTRADRAKERSIPTAIANELRDLSPFIVGQVLAFVESKNSEPPVQGIHASFFSTWYTPPPYSPPRG